MNREEAATLDLIPAHVEDDIFPQVSGALIGAAAADALGWITEFVRGRGHLLKLYGTDLVTEYRGWEKTSGGRFNAYVDRINKGEYSDDTQLTLAIARSLTQDGGIDIEHFSKKELPLWLDYARGAGATITAAARAIARKKASWNSNFFTYRQGGRERQYQQAGANGAAMRVAPIALANLRNPERMVAGVWQTAVVTHGHPRAIVGAIVYAEALRLCCLDGSHRTVPLSLDQIRELVSQVTLPEGRDWEAWVNRWEVGHPAKFADVWANVKEECLQGFDLIEGMNAPGDLQRALVQLGCFDSARKGSGVGTVLAGLAIFLSAGQRDFREGVITAINQLGADTDTIGGFVGGLCGAFHGYQSVPTEWATELQDYDYFMRVATELARISSGVGMGGKALLPSPQRDIKLADIRDLLNGRSINPDERVFHPLFGTGWVKSVDAQRLHRKDDARVVLARVQFDIGQSCKFRHMEIHGKRQASKSRSKSAEQTDRGQLF